MILIYDSEKTWASMPQDESKKMFGEYMAYTEELKKAGVMKSGAPLKPVSTATTVRVRDGKRLTTDGPFAETKEQLAGYYLIDVPSLDEAIHWAGKCPSSRIGSIEVRPIMEM
jgi:hypothetical protein